MFCRLGVFAGSFGLDAAETVACGPQVPRDDVLDLLGRLVAQSLVVVEKHHGSVRYRLLEILRAYARARLEERGELHATLVRHADYYVTLAERAEPELYSERQQSWLIDADVCGLLCIHSPGERLTGALARFWLNRGYLTEGRRWLIDVLARHTGAPAGCRAKALGGAGTLAEFQGDHQQAQALQEESLALWRELADKRGIAAALNNLGDVARQRGDYALARSRYEDSVTLAREARDAWRVASSLHQLADVARLLGDVESARQQFEECLELWRDLRDPQGLTAALTSLGELASFDGDAAAARDFLDQALDLARSLGNTWGTA